MALSRRNGQRFEANIWPGFVDAMTALLLVLVFVLSIFMIVQFMLRETITSQDSELDQLSSQVLNLAEALGLEQQRGFTLEEQVSRLDGALQEQLTQAEQQATLIASLTAQSDAQAGRIASFEEQVAGLLRQRDGLQSQVATLNTERDVQDAERARIEGENAGLVARIADIEAGLAREISEKEAAQLALAQARTEINQSAEAARLAAARREVLEALVADLETQKSDAEAALSEAEIARVADAAAAEALRERLQNADAELTAMTLSLEAQRKEAEDTLTLLAAANAAKEDLDTQLLTVLNAAQSAQTDASQRAAELQAELDAARAEGQAGQAAIDQLTKDRDAALQDLRNQIAAALAAQKASEAAQSEALTEAEQRAILLATARDALAEEKQLNLQSQRQVEALNQQVAALRTQLGSLQSLLDESGARDEASNVQIQALGSQLNAALAQVASEQKRTVAEQERRLALEEAERKRLEEEANELKNYRSEFFGQLRALLGNQDGVRIQGDRFVFSSEVLFQPARADLSAAGREEIAKVARILSEVSSDIPDTLDWVIRVDGHTDNTPLSGFGQFADNWELSQARALSVVRYMSQDLGIPPERLAANGFGEFQPVAEGDSPAALAANRRIELKLTEK